MKKVYKFNKEWLDLLLEHKNNKNLTFNLSDNDTRLLLTYIEVLQNRIDKAFELLQLLHYNFPDYDEIHHRIQDIEDILKESGE